MRDVGNFWKIFWCTKGISSMEFCYLRRFFDEKVSALLITVDLN